MCDYRKHVHISAIYPGICQNSPNPFPPPPTALNRKKEERQGYRKETERLTVALENRASYLYFTIKGQ